MFFRLLMIGAGGYIGAEEKDATWCSPCAVRWSGRKRYGLTTKLLACATDIEPILNDADLDDEMAERFPGAVAST